MDNTKTGNQGEDLACKFLESKGYKILERNFRIRGGEIDIVAQEKQEIVFVEVKARYSREYGGPAEAITPWKIKAMLKSALFYLQNKNWLSKGYRLDFVGIDFAKSKENPEIELIQNITN